MQAELPIYTSQQYADLYIITLIDARDEGSNLDEMLTIDAEPGKKLLPVFYAGYRLTTERCIEWRLI